MRLNVCSVKHINALLRCSLVVTAVALLRSLLRSALLRSSVNAPSGHRQKIFRRRADQDREIPQKTFLHFINGGLGGALSMHLKLSPRKRWSISTAPCNPFPRAISENFRSFLYEKILYPGPHLALIIPALNVNLADTWWEGGACCLTSAC